MAGEFDEVMQNFNRFADRVAGPLTERTVNAMAITALAYSDSMVPRATSNLLNSHFWNIEMTSRGYEAELGYSAFYAIFVHEAPGVLLGANKPRYPTTDGVVWGPDGEPEFLRKGVEMMFKNDGRRIMQEYQV